MFTAGGKRLAAVVAVVAALTGVLAQPVASAQARACPRCVKVQFAKHIPWRSFNHWADSRLRNPFLKFGIKGRLKAYAREQRNAFAGCRDSEFMRKVCDAAKACLLAGGTTLLAVYAGGADIWAAERQALYACEGAILTVVFR